MTLYRIRPFAVDQDHGRFEFPQTHSVSGVFVRQGAEPEAEPQIGAYYAGADGTPYFKTAGGVVIDLSDTGPYPPLVGVLVLDDGILLGTGTTLDFGDNLNLEISGSSVRIDASDIGHTTGTLVVYSADSFVGVFEEMRFRGGGVAVENSGTYVSVFIEPNPAGVDQIGAYVTDDGVPVGTGTTFDFGDNLDVSISGTRIRVDAQAGGGGVGGSGSVVILDEGIVQGAAEEIDFVGAGVETTISGTRAQVSISGGGSGDPATYVRAGEAAALTDPPGLYWQIPIGGYATGTLSVALNGIWQTPEEDYLEQHQVSGTFEFTESIPTGSIVSVIWGIEVENGGGGSGGHQTGTMVIYDDDAFVGVFEEMRLRGAGVAVQNSGTYVSVQIDPNLAEGVDQIGVYGLDDGLPLGTGTILDFGDNLDVSISGTSIRVNAQAGGAEGGSGSVVLLDEGVVQGSGLELDFVGPAVEVTVSGTRAQIAIGAAGEATYVRAGEAVPLDTPTGAYWQVPDEVYSTGTLAVGLNGIWQTPVEDYTEQFPPSGTFEFTESIPTGSIVSAIWGVPAPTLGGGGVDALLDGGVILEDADELDFVGGVDLTASGTRAQVQVGGMWAMRKSSSQTLTNGALDQITFDTAEVGSDGSVIDLSNNRFTAEDDGLYLAIVHWIWQATIPAVDSYMQVLVNGSNVPPLIRGSVQNGNLSREGTVPLQLSAGDNVTVEITPGAVTGATARGNASSHLSTTFTLVRVG